MLLAALPALGGADASVFSVRYPEIWRIAAAVLMLAPVLGLFVHAFGDRTMIEFAPAAITLLVVVLALGNLDLMAPVHVGALGGEGVTATRLPNPDDTGAAPGEWEARVTVTVHSKTEVAGLTLHHREVSEATVLARWSSTPDRAVFCHVGCAPSQYAMRLRLRHARHLLLQTGLPLLEIAMAVGFSSRRYFSKCYKRQFGRSPKEERVHYAALR